LSSRWEGNITPDNSTEPKTIIPVGTPVTRKVLIEVQGQHARRIPLHEQRVDEPQRQYADQPVFARELTPTSLNSSKLLSATLIAPQSGEFSLPPLSIDWWDINKKTWRTSVLNRETFQVVADPSALSAAQSEAIRPLLNNWLQHTFKRIGALPVVSLVLMGMFAVALVLLCYWQWRRWSQSTRNANNAQHDFHKTPATEAAAWRELRKNMNIKKLTGIRQALLHWVAKRWPDEQYQELEQIKTRWPELAHPLSTIEELLYSKNGALQPTQPCKAKTEAQLKTLRKQLVELRKRASADGCVSSPSSMQSELKPLYQNN